MGAAPESDERLLQTFLDLVRIDSPSRSEARCAQYCAAALRDVGCTVRFDDSASTTGSDTGNLIAELAGDGPGTLVLSAHFDCVQPCEGVVPQVSDGVVFSAGDTVLGADDKAGLAVIIETLRRLTESGKPRPTIRCVLTVQEEIGLLGAKSLEPGAATGDLCLVLDATGQPGGIVVGAPTHYTFIAEYTGKAAHAGVAPETGVSAIEMASHAIARMELGRLDAHTTANVGTVHGGTATNVVAAKVGLTGECRSLERERVEEVRARMHETMQDVAAEAGGEVDIVWTLEYEGFLMDAGAPQVQLVAAACADVGLEPATFTTGGGSDANVISAAGTPTVALSCGMEGVHSTAEQIEARYLEELTELVVAVARRMARGI